MLTRPRTRFFVALALAAVALAYRVGRFEGYISVAHAVPLSCLASAPAEGDG